jgi:LmbE family N-acetylglucosaminyl deacetylase
MNRLALVTVFLAATAGATEPAMHAGELAHALDRLGTTGRVLYVAAHPDDENTRLLAYLASARHLTVAYLAMTRGGGGQNLIGREQSELLDVIRTEELLAARRIDAAHQRFTRMRDFGYSKSADETFSKWGHEEALSDVVWVIRTFQPDVIITRFTEKPPNHGHHTASAILAREAFEAAADPRRFPEQLTGGVTPWRATRLLQNGWRDAEPPPKEVISLDVGVYDPRLGLGYGELAALSRSQHKSQGFGVPGERGQILERFLPIAGTAPTKDLLDGVDVGWGRLNGATFARAIDEARAALDRDHPEKALPALARAQAAIEGLPDSPRVRDTRRALDRVMASAAGVFVRATAARPVASPGSSVEISVEVVARTAPVVLRRVELPGAAPVAGKPEPLTEKQVLAVTVTLPAEAPVSVPYWLEERSENGRYPVRDRTLIGQPKGPPALAATVELVIAGRTVKLEAPVEHSWTDPVHGERVRDFLIAPPATVTPVRAAFMFPERRAAPVLLRVRAARDGVRGDVDLGLPTGWKSQPATQVVELAKAGDETTVRFQVTPPANGGAIDVSPTLRVDGRAWSYREDVIDHPHIPLQLVLEPATARLVPLALRLPRGTIGYIPGSWRFGRRGPGARRAEGGRARRTDVARRRSLALRRHRRRHPRLQHAAGGARRQRAAHGVRRRRRRGGRAVQHQQPARPARGHARAVPARDRPRARHRREGEDGAGRSEKSTPQAAERHRPRRLRGLGAGARHLLRRQVGREVPAALQGRGPRGRTAPRQRARRQTWQGALRLHRAGLLPRAPGRGPRRLSPPRQPPLRRSGVKPEEDPPPFLGTWGNVYLLVLGELALLIALFAAITRWAS